MKKQMVLWIVLLLSLLNVRQGFSEKSYSLTASAPDAVVAGEQFSVVFSANGDAKEFRAPSFEGFDILMGPSKSVSSSTSFINGKMSSEYNVTFTYILMAQKEGTFTIAPATALIDKGRYTTQPLSIKVLKSEGGNSAPQSSGDASRPSQERTSVSKGEEVFVRLSLSKTKLYEQECLLVTFKLYTRLDISGFEKVQFPEFEGFIAQEIELPEEKHFSMDTYNGRNYHTAVIKQTLLFPQRTGELKIPSGHFDAIVRVRTQQHSRSIFDSFFESYSDVKRTLTSQSATITVLPLPSGKPEGFGGGVGNFSVKSSISANSVEANEAVTLKIDISGKGNIKLIKTPEIKFPSDFEIYDPKVDVKVSTSASGVTGSKSIEYLIVPRFGGDYEIPETPFAYFDTQSKSYKVLTIPSYKLHVNKGKGEENRGGNPVGGVYSTKEDVKHLAKDIRFIKTKEVKLRNRNQFLYGSQEYILCYLLAFLCFLFSIYYYRKQIKLNGDLTLYKMRKADKVAKKRLKMAKKCLESNNKERYYEELSKALWGYLSDKLGIPLASLNRDTIQEQLLSRRVSQESIQRIIRVLNLCEEARYAPQYKESKTMTQLYEETWQIIKN